MVRVVSIKTNEYAAISVFYVPVLNVKIFETIIYNTCPKFFFQLDIFAEILDHYENHI